MDFADVMQFLEDASDPQIARIYDRRNPGGSLLGVRFGDMEKVIKRIKRDSSLARELWATGILEPELIACRVMDPADITEAEIDDWVKQARWPITADRLANLVYRTPFADKKRKAWTRSNSEFIRRAGFTLVFDAAADPKTTVTDEEFRAYLDQIGRDIQGSKNWSREMMNMVPIAIGLRSAELKADAIAVATAYGPVDVFHGDKTNCKVTNVVEALNNPKTKVKPPA